MSLAHLLVYMHKCELVRSTKEGRGAFSFSFWKEGWGVAHSFKQSRQKKNVRGRPLAFSINEAKRKEKKPPWDLVTVFKWVRGRERLVVNGVGHETHVVQNERDCQPCLHFPSHFNSVLAAPVTISTEKEDTTAGVGVAATIDDTDNSRPPHPQSHFGCCIPMPKKKKNRIMKFRVTKITCRHIKRK